MQAWLILRNVKLSSSYWICPSVPRLRWHFQNTPLYHFFATVQHNYREINVIVSSYLQHPHNIQECFKYSYKKSFLIFENYVRTAANYSQTILSFLQEIDFTLFKSKQFHHLKRMWLENVKSDKIIWPFLLSLIDIFSCHCVKLFQRQMALTSALQWMGSPNMEMTLEFRR